MWMETGITFHSLIHRRKMPHVNMIVQTSITLLPDLFKYVKFMPLVIRVYSILIINVSL